MGVKYEDVIIGEFRFHRTPSGNVEIYRGDVFVEWIDHADVSGWIASHFPEHIETFKDWTRNGRSAGRQSFKKEPTDPGTSSTPGS